MQGGQAELAWVAGYIARWFMCLKTVTHPTTKWAKCRATLLTETNALPLCQTIVIKARCNDLTLLSRLVLAVCIHLRMYLTLPFKGLRMPAYKMKYWNNFGWTFVLLSSMLHTALTDNHTWLVPITVHCSPAIHADYRMKIQLL